MTNFARRSAGAGDLVEGNDMDDTKRILDINENLIRINSELVEVNKGWQKLATEMLHMWAEERAEWKGKQTSTQ